MAKENNKNFLSRLLKLLYYVVIIFVCVISFLLLFYIVSAQIHADDEDYKPAFSIYTIVSPSMTPVINVYDVVVNVKVNNPSDIKVGDIITYKSAAANSEGMTITHRVVDVSKLPDGTYEYMTQGDNNSEPDSLYVLYDNVIGKEVLIIPYLGRLQFFIANQKGWLFLLLIPVSIYLIREVIKLIDLFHLRKRVDKVVGTIEGNFVDKKKYEKLRDEERKREISEELKSKEVKRNSVMKSKEEPEGFLEKYSETKVSITENKYNKAKKVIQEPTDDEVKVIAPTKVRADKVKKIEENLEEKEIILPKQLDDKSQYEILDTDELTSKIKEYDNKIEKLDKMIKDIEGISKDKKKVEEIIIEEDDYLKGHKIKVVNVEPTKNQRTRKKSVSSKSSTSKKKEISIELNSLVPNSNPHQRITRPKSEDIKTLRARELNTPTKKEKLNLNPKSVKKVNRHTKTRDSKVPSKKQLNLKNNTVKKVNRPSKTKKSLIVIEKTK